MKRAFRRAWNIFSAAGSGARTFFIERGRPIESRLSMAAAEFRGNLKDPPQWLLELLGGFASGAGIRVNPTNAIELAPVYACTNVLAQTISTLPLHLMQRTAEGRRKAAEHSLYRLLHFSPNPEMVRVVWMQMVMFHLCMWGNHYAEIERDRAGRVIAIWPLLPNRVRVFRDWHTLEVYYIVSPLGGGQVKLLPWQVLHIKGLSFNGLVGLSPIGAAREVIGVGLGAMEYGARFFGNSAMPSGILTFPGRLSDTAKKRMQESWEKQHQGLEMAQRIAILEEGLKFEAIGLKPEDAQFLQTRNLTAEDVCRYYRMPPHKIGIMDKSSTRANIEQENISFITDTILPWAVNIEAELQFKLLLDSEVDDHFFWFLLDGYLRGDIASRYEAYAKGRQWGWLSVNDVRRYENLNPIGPDGDIYLSPLNMVPAGQADQVIALKNVPGGGGDRHGHAADPLLERLSNGVHR